MLRFNPRTREGCDNYRFGRSVATACFNPRTREGCDFLPASIVVDVEEFQSTHPRRVRPIFPLFCRKTQTVSIHAPAKGATSVRLAHATYGYSFNPRTREGCDSLRSSSSKALVVVSIHAPAKGATRKSESLRRRQGSFNPRTREGCDIVEWPCSKKLWVSIHAPAKGATL